MQPHLHPAHGPVAFRDRATGRVLVVGSTPAERTTRAVEVDGTRETA